MLEAWQPLLGGWDLINCFIHNFNSSFHYLPACAKYRNPCRAAWRQLPGPAGASQTQCAHAGRHSSAPGCHPVLRCYRGPAHGGRGLRLCDLRQVQVHTWSITCGLWVTNLRDTQWFVYFNNLSNLICEFAFPSLKRSLVLRNLNINVYSCVTIYVVYTV